MTAMSIHNTDTELMALLDRVAARDDGALHTLYEQTAPRLYGLALRVVRRRDTAEDVLQETFLTIWRVAPDYRAALSPPMAWLCLIVRSRALDALRRRTTERSDLTDAWDDEAMSAMDCPSPRPEDLTLAGEQAFALHQCMSHLAAQQREVISLAYLSDGSHAQVSEQLQLPLGTVKTWIRRGIEQLRTCLARYV